MHSWTNVIKNYQQLTDTVLQKVKLAGAHAAEIRCYANKGFLASVRKQVTDTLEYHQDKKLALTVYFDHCKGSASTTNFSVEAVDKLIEASCNIARLAQPDTAVGLADEKYLAITYPDLMLHYESHISPTQAIEIAKEIEKSAYAVDRRIFNTENVGVETQESLIFYANTSQFNGYYLTSQHTMSCALVAQEGNSMQQDNEYTTARDPCLLKTAKWLAQTTSEKVVRRLGAKPIKTCKAPVIFEAPIAKSLLRYFLSAISGDVLYQESSFLLHQLGKKVFPMHFTIKEEPHLLSAMGSIPFDAEGVRTSTKNIVTEGILQTYLLNSYTARRLGLITTGHAGGFSNIILETNMKSLPDLFVEMGEGLFVTETIGHGINLITGDYSQGVFGFWIQNGKIQYPVEEVTIAGNLKQMYQNIVGMADDVDKRGKIQTGSILIEEMTIAGR